MEFIVLGLLMFKDLTIYEINRTFKDNLSIIYSASYGSIQNAILKLMKRNEIGYSEVVEGGRRKKIYRIHPSGVEVFYHWMKDDVKTNKFEVQMLSKIYFLGFVESKQDKLLIVKNLLNQAELQLEELKAMDQDAFGLVKGSSTGTYPFKTLDYALMSRRHGYEWLQELYREIEAS